MTTGVRRQLPVEAMVCAVLAVVVFLSFDLWRPFNMGDEAFRYLLSRSWARGENLFQRFLVLYPTGSYAFYGSIMRMLGEGLWVLRLGRAVLGGAAVFLLFVTLRRRDASWLPWALAIAITTSCAALVLGAGVEQLLKFPSLDVASGRKLRALHSFDLDGAVVELGVHLSQQPGLF